MFDFMTNNIADEAANLTYNVPNIQSSGLDA